MRAAPKKLAAALIIMALATIAIPIFFPSTSAQTSGNIQNDFLVLVNAERASLGKTFLAANTQLETAAYLHSKDMGDNDYFSHTSQDGTQFSQRITAAGYKWVSAAENIAYAYGAADAAKVYDMWKNSEGHYANMIGNYADAGLGVYSINGYTYYTLDLGRSQNPSPTPKPTASPTPTPSPTATPNPTPTPTLTPTPTPTTTPAPTPTPTPIASPTPKPSTPQPTAIPTSTSTPQTSTATPTPSIPELPLLILLPTILLGLLLAAAIKLKNQRLTFFMFN
jgi:uncharacterized protein YkwD